MNLRIKKKNNENTEIDKNIENYSNNFCNNKKINLLIKYFLKILVLSFCAIVSAFEYKILIAPNIEKAIFILPTGISGLSTIVSTLLRDFFNFDYYKAFSIVDNIFNIPSFLIAFYFFGFRFGFFTTIYVIISNLLINLDFQFANNFAIQIANIIENNGIYYQTSGLLTRAILAAFCSGLTSSLIISLNASSGGMSTINYFLASRKSKNIGYYSIITNISVALLFTTFSFFKKDSIFLNTILSLTFAIVYVILFSIIIDTISPQNKKEQISIITTKEKADEILKLIPLRGATIINSIGKHSKKDKVILSLIVSSYEIDETIELIKKIDSSCFLYVTKIKRVYGGFFIKKTD